jgi:hypothetical protein
LYTANRNHERTAASTQGGWVRPPDDPIQWSFYNTTALADFTCRVEIIRGINPDFRRAFSSQLALAQFTQQGPKLVGTGASGAAAQGSVALSADGNTAIVGGPADYSGTGTA